MLTPDGFFHLHLQGPINTSIDVKSQIVWKSQNENWIVGDRCEFEVLQKMNVIGQIDGTRYSHNQNHNRIDLIFPEIGTPVT